MKIKALVTAALLLVLMAAFAGAEVRTVPMSFSGVNSLVTGVTINGTASATSDFYDITFARYFSLQWICTSAAGAPDIKIEWLAGSGASTTLMLEPTSVTDVVASYTSESWTAPVSVQPPVSPVAGIKITGNAANTSDTACSVYLNMGN